MIVKFKLHTGVRRDFSMYAEPAVSRSDMKRFMTSSATETFLHTCKQTEIETQLRGSSDLVKLTHAFMAACGQRPEQTLCMKHLAADVQWRAASEAVRVEPESVRSVAECAESARAMSVADDASDSLPDSACGTTSLVAAGAAAASSGSLSLFVTGSCRGMTNVAKRP